MRKKLLSASSLFFYANMLLLVSSGIIALWAFIFLALLILFGGGFSRLMYWLYFSPLVKELTVTLSAGGFLVIGGIFLVVAIAGAPFPRLRIYTRLGAQAVLMLVFACLLTYIAHWIEFLRTGPLGGQEHIDSVRVGSHIYHLSLEWGDYAETYSHYYHLYECDSLDLLYVELRTISKGDGIRPPVRKIELVADEAARRIIIMVNDAVAYTHPAD